MGYAIEDVEQLLEMREALMQRGVEHLIEKRSLKFTPELQQQLRDALEAAYRTLYRPAIASERRPPRDAFEVLLNELAGIDERIERARH